CNSRQTEGRAVHLQSRTRHRSRNPCRPCRGHGASGTRGSPPMKTVQTSNRNAALRALVAIAVLVALAAALFLFAPEEAYNWIKAIHVIAVISWMAGMLYLPRLFVYHADAEKGSVQSETFKVMERRLLRAIINPAMIVSWVMGLWLAWKGFGFHGGWL